MTPHESGDKAAGRYDLEAALAGIVEGGTHEARADPLALVGRRHLGVREDRAIALLAINHHREAMLGVELVAACGRVVSHGFLPHPIKFLCNRRSTSQNIG